MGDVKRGGPAGAHMGTATEDATRPKSGYLELQVEVPTYVMSCHVTRVREKNW